MELAGRKVLVLGLGETGLSMARWVARQGGTVRAADTRAAPPALAALRAALPQAQVTTGTFTPALLDGVDLVAASPGVPLAEPVVATALARGLEVVGDVELFARFLAEQCAHGGAQRRADHRDHRHQRQEHGHRARRRDVPRGGGRLRGGRQHLAGRARRTRRTARCGTAAGGVGNRAVELPARDDRVPPPERCDRAQRVARPPGPIREPGRLRRREGADLRRRRRAGPEPGRPGEHGDAHRRPARRHVRARPGAGSRRLRAAQGVRRALARDGRHAAHAGARHAARRAAQRRQRPRRRSRSAARSASRSRRSPMRCARSPGCRTGSSASGSSAASRSTTTRRAPTSARRSRRSPGSAGS